MDVVKEIEKVGADILLTELPNLEQALEQILKNAGTDPSVALVLKRQIAATHISVTGKLDSLSSMVKTALTTPEQNPIPVGGSPATPGPCESCGHVPGTQPDNTPKGISTEAAAGSGLGDAAGKAESAASSTAAAGTGEAAEVKQSDLPAEGPDHTNKSTGETVMVLRREGGVVTYKHHGESVTMQEIESEFDKQFQVPEAAAPKKKKN